jgi:hypothetical protein
MPNDEPQTPEPSQIDSELVRVRLDRPLLDALNAWIATQPEPRPSRPRAIRRVLADALGVVNGAGTIAAEDLNASNDE